MKDSIWKNAHLLDKYVFDPYGDLENRYHESMELSQQLEAPPVVNPEPPYQLEVMYGIFLATITRHHDEGKLSDDEYQDELNMIIRGFRALHKGDDNETK